MKESQEILAWRKSSDPNGILYYEEDLNNRSIVNKIFSSCRKNEGFINADGWEYLFKQYELSDLLEIDLDSGWFNQKATGRAFNLVFQSLMAGYNPIDKEKGDFDTETSDFLSLNGVKRKVEWEKIKVLNLP